MSGNRAHSWELADWILRWTQSNQANSLLESCSSVKRALFFPTQKRWFFIRVSLLNNQDLLFYLTPQVNLILCSHIIDYKAQKILVKNTSDWPLYVPSWQKLSHLLDIAYDNCFFWDIWTAYDSATISSSSHLFSNLSARFTLLPTDFPMETLLDHGIRVYRDASAVKQISDLVAEYPSI